jgi:predicted transcriptional regulator
MSRNRDTLTEVCHAIVLDAPSGKTPKEIAKALGRIYTTLMNELAIQPGAKLGADMVLPLMLQTGSMDPLHYLADNMGCVVIELPRTPAGMDPLSLQAMQAVEEMGQVMGEFRKAVADGVVTAKEKALVRAEIYETIQALTALGAALELA